MFLVFKAPVTRCYFVSMEHSCDCGAGSFPSEAQAHTHTRAHTYSAIPQGVPGIIFNCDNEFTKTKAEFPKVSFRKPQGEWKWGFRLNLSANQQAWKSNMFLKTAGCTSFVRSWHYHCFIRLEGFGGLGLRLISNFGDGFQVGVSMVESNL